MTSDLRERLRQVDPAPVAAEPPSGAMRASAVLFEIERRMGMDTRDTTREEKATTATGDAGPAADPEALKKAVRGRSGLTWSRARVAVAAVVAVAVVGSVYAVINAVSDSPLDAASSQAIADEYIAAFNAGDSEAVMSLFSDDAAFSFNFVNSPVEVIERPDWEQRLVWNAAQGTMLQAAACATADGVEGGTFTVSCAYQTVDAPSQAAGTQGVSTTATLTISANGISEINEAFGFPDFTEVGLRFDAWVEVNHPEIANGIVFGNWTSVESAEQNGLLRAQYAQLWNVYLTENGCTYNQSRQSCLGDG